MPQERFPLAGDYDLAVRNAHLFVLDPVIKRARVRYGKGGDPLMYAGGYARVFRFDADGKQYALRCWIADSGDSLDIYREAHSYIKQRPSSCFVDFEFLQDGIVVGGKCWPTVRMDWVDGSSLKDFIQKNLSKPAVIAHLRDEFVGVCRHLHDDKIAHGDLQPENIRVRNGGAKPAEIVLIDYDSLVVPARQGKRSAIAGLPAFQHPARGKSDKATCKLDYFSELVIYISLLAFERNPGLWHKHEVEQRDGELLLAPNDFLFPRTSQCLAEVSGIDREMKALTGYLTWSCEAPGIDELQPLEWILSRVQSGVLPPKPKAFELFLFNKIQEGAGATAPVAPSPNKVSRFENALRRNARPLPVGPGPVPLIAPPPSPVPPPTPPLTPVVGTNPKRTGVILLFIGCTICLWLGMCAGETHSSPGEVATFFFAAAWMCDLIFLIIIAAKSIWKRITRP